MPKGIWPKDRGVFKDGCSGSTVFLAPGCRMPGSHPSWDPLVTMYTSWQFVLTWFCGMAIFIFSKLHASFLKEKMPAGMSSLLSPKAYSGPCKPAVDMEQVSQECACHQKDPRCQPTAALQRALHIPHGGKANRIGLCSRGDASYSGVGRRLVQGGRTKDL